MKRLVIWAVVGIGLLLAGAVATIFLLGDGGQLPGVDPVPFATSGSTGGDAVLRPPPNPPPPPLTTGATPVAPAIEYGPAPARPPAGSWEAVAPVARPGALGRVGGAISQGLADLQPRLDECQTAASQARNSGQPVSEVKDGVVADDNGTATLMLQVEGLEGAVRIVDAPVEMRGGASVGLIACVQQVLRGQVIPAAAATPGTRYRIVYPLTP